MVKPAKNQICLLCVAVVIPCIVFTSFLGLGPYPIIFTVPILVLSASFLVRFTKKTKSDAVEEKVLQETVSESDAAPIAGNGIIVDEFQVESVDLTSETESSTDDDSGSSDQNLEMNWMVSGNHVEQNITEILSDDSTSDDDDDEEEGLIEITIPGTPGVSEEPKANIVQSINLGNFLPESIFRQQDLVELLMAEMNEANEEENLIEIDISIGSIKLPSFEIEA